MELRKLRATVAIAAAAAMLMTVAMVTPALGKGPTPKTIQFDSSEYIVWEGHPDAYDIGIGLIRSVKTGTPSVTITIGATGDAAVADQDYSVAETPVTVTFARNQTRVFNAATIAALSDNDESVESNETITLTLSSPSSKWSIGTPSTATVTIHEEPAVQAPVDLVAAPIGSDMMDVSWTMPSTWPGTGYPTGYGLTFSVQRSPNGTDWTWLEDTTSYSVMDYGLEPGTTYYYQVSVWNEDGATALTLPFTGTTGMPPPTPTCWAEQDYYDPTVVHVTWTIKDDYVGDPVYFHVQSSSDSGETWTWVASTWEYSADDTDLAVIPDYYRVDAETQNGTVESEPCSWGS